MDNFKTIFSAKRKELRMTQKEIAERLNVSDKTISKWETGSSYPDITLLNSIAQVLEIDVSSLLGATDLKESTAEKEVYDISKIQKFKNMSIIAMLLQILGLVLISMIPILELENDNVAIVLLLVMGIGSIMTGFALFLISVSNFRNFYTHKFFTKEYDLVYYRYTAAFIHILLFICLLLFLSISFQIFLTFAVALFPAFGFFLFRIRKSLQMQLKRNASGWILIVLTALFLMAAGLFLIPNMIPVTYGIAVWGLLAPLFVLSIILSYHIEYKEK